MSLDEGEIIVKGSGGGGTAGTGGTGGAGGAAGAGGAVACREDRECDDGNPCTDDVCTKGQCASTNNQSTCDDGVFCNGIDTCRAGACVDHAGNPCVGTSRCDEAARTCVGCAVDADCPPMQPGPWSLCDGYASPCETQGTRVRDVTRYACRGGTCEATITAESEACVRNNRDGTTCGESHCEAWNDCGDWGGACSVTGTQSRACTDRICEGGACAAKARDESRSCTRSNRDGVGCNDRLFCNGSDTCKDGACTVHAGSACPGMSQCDEQNDTCVGCATNSDCPAQQFGAWSECGGYANTCDDTGTRTRDVTTYVCSMGTCKASVSQQSGACTRASRDGVSCGTSTCAAWGACGGYANACDSTGTQTRTCTDLVCSAGTCGSKARSETQDCSRGNLNGTSCGATSCSSYTCVANAGVCVTSGTLSRTCQVPVCSGGTCVNSVQVQTGVSCAYDPRGRSCPISAACAGSAQCDARCLAASCKNDLTCTCDTYD